MVSISVRSCALNLPETVACTLLGLLPLEAGARERLADARLDFRRRVLPPLACCEDFDEENDDDDDDDDDDEADDVRGTGVGKNAASSSLVDSVRGLGAPAACPIFDKKETV